MSWSTNLTRSWRRPSVLLPSQAGFHSDPHSFKLPLIPPLPLVSPLPLDIQQDCCQPASGKRGGGKVLLVSGLLATVHDGDRQRSTGFPPFKTTFDFSLSLSCSGTVCDRSTPQQRKLDVARLGCSYRYC